MELQTGETPFSVSLEEDGDGLVVRLAGDFDLLSAPEAAEALGAACDRGGRIVVDLADVTFMDSSGLQALVAARRRADRDGCSLLVGRISEPVRQVLELTHTLDWLGGRG
jgi:anti-sigma B factor antagonist